MRGKRRASIVLGCLIAAGIAQAAELKVGVFDFQRVSEETARGQELQSSLARFRDKKQAEITGKESDLKSLRDQYTAQALTLSPDKRAQLEKDIQKKDLELQSAREAAQREMQLEVNEAQAKFQEQLFRIIQALGKDRGYTLIFEKTQAVFASDAIDITSEIIERFNQETAASAQPSGGGTAPASKPTPADEKKPAPASPSAGKPGSAKP